MSAEGTRQDDLRGFSAGARRALELAEQEARSLGHDRVGTEHLLLGLLASEDGQSSGALREAGATLEAARRKVVEAVGPVTGGGGDPSSTPRCARAVRRAPRFARDQQSDVVGSEHLLLAVLDVEGTAGQVLRGLGADLEHLRAALGARPTAAPRDDERRHAVALPSPTCPGCGNTVTSVAAIVVPAMGSSLDEVTLLTCPACGAVIGAI
ncbi:MAG: Clp protease N-terminal domain-containing protein [Actinomycetota bacterium]